jgi:hypothetical protein
MEQLYRGTGPAGYGNPPVGNLTLGQTVSIPTTASLGGAYLQSLTFPELNNTNGGLGDIWNIVNHTLANGMLPTNPQGIYMVRFTESNRIRLLLFGIHTRTFDP